MDTRTETTLLEYVIAYLQEEQHRHYDVVACQSKQLVSHYVNQAIEAYEGGAR